MEFPSIAVCDGIAMGHSGMNYSLASRELIADLIETMAMAHSFDGWSWQQIVIRLYRYADGRTEG